MLLSMLITIATSPHVMWKMWNPAQTQVLFMEAVNEQSNTHLNAEKYTKKLGVVPGIYRRTIRGISYFKQTSWCITGFPFLGFQTQNIKSKQTTSTHVNVSWSSSNIGAQDSERNRRHEGCQLHPTAKKIIQMSDPSRTNCAVGTYIQTWLKMTSKDV